MKYRKLSQIISTLVGIGVGILLAQVAVAVAEAPDEYLSANNIANLLGWAPTQTNLCRGYFFEPPELLAHVNDPSAPTNLQSQISAAGPTLFSRNGPSILMNDVVYVQPGRRMATADKAVIYRNADTGRLTLIHLSGHVRLREPGQLVVGPYGTLNLSAGTADFGPAAYHVLESPSQYHPLKATYNGWGQAHQVERHANGVLDLYHTTYSTCAPEKHPPWQIYSAHVQLDHDKAIGHAYNSVLRFKGVPVFYVPYYTFPLNSDRKSGLLFPSVDYSSNNGLGLRLPIYWNLAPNYDLLFTPRIMTTRGIQFNALLRYLNSFSYNHIYASFMPYDFGFAKFRQDTLDNPPNINPVTLQPYLDQLSDDSATRAFLSMTNEMNFSPDWHAHIIANYVSDSYYFKDFGNVYGLVNNDQLLDQIDTTYTGNHWDLFGMVQGFQTLHQIGNAGGDVQSQYLRMPEFDINANYPNQWQGLLAQLSAQSVDFWYHSDFNPTTTKKPIGERLHVLPSLSRPFNWVFGYVTPQIGLDSTSYYAENSITSDDQESRPQVQASRNLPVIDIDSGLYFERIWDLGIDGYIQTLEPRLFYLYVPYKNQDQYPLFDTQLLSFSFDQLFSLNRFSGVDRLENANQFSLGVTSRFLDSATSAEKFKMDLGVIYYITPPKVCLKPQNCQGSTFNKLPPDSQWSPIVSDMSYQFLPNWSTKAEYGWNPDTSMTDHGKVELHYSSDPLHIWNIGYEYIPASGSSEDEYGLSNNTNYVYTGMGWPITDKLSALGYVYYNFSKERVDNVYGGLQYDSCCWAIRTVISRDWISNDKGDNGDVINHYETTYSVQVELKSVGGFGTGEKSLSGLGGFSDPFKD